MARRPLVLLNRLYYLYAFLGIDLHNLFLIYLSLKYLPTKMGSSASNSAKIQPKAEHVLFFKTQIIDLPQISIFSLYSQLPNNNSGALKT